MGKDSVELNFLPYGRFVFAYSLCNSGFCRTIGDACEDNAPLLQGKVRKRINISHLKHLPFRRLSGTLNVRLNATFVEVEISERLKSTLSPSKWK